MTVPWTRDRVLALAPDSSSAAAGQKLARPGPWDDQGWDDQALWGLCQGSGKRPYQTVVELQSPAFKCSCPSRKFPCKHALGLMLLWSDSGVARSEQQPDHVREWLAGRSERTARSTARSAGTDKPEKVADPEAAARRQAQRAERVAAGLEELDIWLRDQVRGGLAGLERAGYQHFEQVAARMVDAQAPGVAGLLRGIPARLAGEGWPGRALEQLGLLRLLVTAHRRLDELPPDLRDTVRSRVGYPISQESVTALPPVRDSWAALGSVDTVEFKLTSRRVWLRGAASGRWAMLLSFAPPGQSLDSTVMPGVSIDAELHFYPGSGQFRALLGTEHGRRDGVPPQSASTSAAVAGDFASLIAADPWADRLPAVVEGTPVPPESDAGWRLRDVDGDAVPLLAAGEPWPLFAQSLGRPVRVFGEWTSRGFAPLSVVPAGSVDTFTPEVASR
jgi:SWIM zinc finger